MAITAGVQFDHYETIAPLGAGGMGEVYRARDTRLAREVAIKVLPADFAQDTDRLNRFEQEARATSALNHPNILTVYDFGTHEGSPYLVMELLEGEELRAQLNAGALPIKRVIDYAQQIAAGLSAAHEKGIVHRDLKPENLFVSKDGRVKILDFGLAKLKPPKYAVDSEAETMKPLTNPGVIMGTVGYMSPEQVRGQETDHRSDIFSFGIILHEMLSGQRTFAGDSLVELMNAILKDEPAELSETNAKISPQLEKIVRRCLEKKPGRRFQTASDLGFALESLTPPSGARRETVAALPAVTEPVRQAPWFGNVRLAWLVAALLLLAALLFAVPYFRRAPAESRATYLYLPLPEKSGTAQNSGSALSPDGRSVVLVAATEGVKRLWLYSFDAPKPMLLAGTEGAQYPFWSPDGRSIGFFAQGKLKKMELAGGMATVLCDAPNGYGGTWSNIGVIVFSPDSIGVGLRQIAESGGPATPVTSLDTARLETGHAFPIFLPDGRHFVFLATSGQPEFRGIRVGSLDNTQSTFLLRADARSEYSAAGYLLLMRGRKILAQRFDPTTLSLSGELVPVTEQVEYEPSGGRAIDLSVFSDRLLLYRSSSDLNIQPLWFDRKGKQIATAGQPAEYQNLQISPDGNQVILERNDLQAETSDLWLFNFARETLTRLTSNPAIDGRQVWSPDGSRIAFSSTRDGYFSIYQRGSSGEEKEELLLKGTREVLQPSDWSSDGKFIVFRKISEKTGSDIELLPLVGERQPRVYLATRFDEYWAKVSPDSRWIAYQSNESGRYEIYVQSFPEPGRKVTVSQGGGSLPRWRRDGKELYYVSGDDKLMAVPVETGAGFSAGTPVLLFEIGGFGRRTNRYVYDVSNDGQKILLLRPLEDSSLRPLTVVQNWTQLLKK